MTSSMFVVFTTPREKPWKVFEQYTDAKAYADQESDSETTSQIYQVDGITNARAAKAAVETGNGKFLVAVGSRASAEQLHEAMLVELGIKDA